MRLKPLWSIRKRNTPIASLNQGSSGAEVRRLQRALTYLGFDPGDIDGTLSPKTQDAVTAFQQHKRFAADGVQEAKTTFSFFVNLT